MTIDIDKHVFLREIRDAGWAKGYAESYAEGFVEGKAEGKAEVMRQMLRRQLRGRFGPLPRWASQRLKTVQLDQIEHWCGNLVTADSLEGVLGKR